MAFGHVSGVAANAVAFFVVLENFLAGRGWILVAGGGTTSIVYRSTGELGTLTMLYTRIRRTAGTAEIYYRVQDDAAGTHTTTEANLVMPGLGAVPFNYWISGDKNCVIMVIKAGVSYTGCYIGTLEPFALAIADERYMHVTIAFNGATRILRRYSGAYDLAGQYWDGMALGTGLIDPNVLDGSRTLLGGYVLGGAGLWDEIYGQPFYITALVGGLGFNSEDTITSGYPAATSDWIAFVWAAKTLCIMTAGILPLGVGESLGYTVQSGLIATGADLFTTVRNFLIALGWTDLAWYVNPGYKRYMTSIGESGVEDIRCKIEGDAAGAGTSFYIGSVDVNGAGFNNVDAGFSAAPVNYPMPYYLFGDLDCFGMAALVNSIWIIVWTGKVITTYPDESIIPHEYKQGTVKLYPGAHSFACLRDRNGLWSLSNNAVDFSFTNSSPNLIDGVTYVLWPVITVVDVAPPYWIFGLNKYLYAPHGPTMTIGDTLQIGPMTFQYLQLSAAIRIA